MDQYTVEILWAVPGRYAEIRWGLKELFTPGVGGYEGFFGVRVTGYLTVEIRGLSRMIPKEVWKKMDALLREEGFPLIWWKRGDRIVRHPRKRWLRLRGAGGWVGDNCSTSSALDSSGKYA